MILLSGGLDSATTLAIAKSAGYTCYALSFSYGQRNKHELNSAKLVAESINVERHIILNSDLSIFGGSALTSDIEVPKGRTEEELSYGGGGKKGGALVRALDGGGVSAIVKSSPIKVEGSLAGIKG